MAGIANASVTIVVGRRGAICSTSMGTILSKTRNSCRFTVQILRGITDSVTTKRLALEFGVDRGTWPAR
jgi:hypothetical protein